MNLYEYIYEQMQNEIDRMLVGHFNSTEDEELNSELEQLMVSSCGPVSAEVPVVRPEEFPAVPSHEVISFPDAPSDPVQIGDLGYKENDMVETRRAVPS